MEIFNSKFNESLSAVQVTQQHLQEFLKRENITPAGAKKILRRPKIEIIEYAGEVDIFVNDRLYHFDQEDTHEKLVEVFNQLGFDATYTEGY